MNLGEVVKKSPKETKFRRKTWQMRDFVCVGPNGVITDNHGFVSSNLKAIIREQCLRDDWVVFDERQPEIEALEDLISSRRGELDRPLQTITELGDKLRQLKKEQ